VALRFVAPLRWLGWVFGVVLIPLLALEGLLGRAMGMRSGTTPAEAEERLRHLVEDTTELEEDEREMIASVIELGEQPIREVMIPRIDMKVLPAASTVAEAIDRIVETGHSRVPLYENNVDNITAVIYAKDVLKYLRGSGNDALAEPCLPLGREPYFVPETKKVDELLQEMRKSRVHMAIVVDEYGGTAGLISIEDLIEEIVGEIQDEYDVEEEHIELVNEHEALFDARVSIRDVNDTLDLELDDEDFDTLGGLLYHELGKVPSAGDEVRVDGARVTVLTTTGRRVGKVRVEKVAVATRPDDDEED
jgi:CBS domain containing-hemolysin-like protein